MALALYKTSAYLPTNTVREPRGSFFGNGADRHGVQHECFVTVEFGHFCFNAVEVAGYALHEQQHFIVIDDFALPYVSRGDRNVFGAGYKALIQQRPSDFLGLCFVLTG